MSWAYPFDHDHGLAPDDLTALVGGKGANLVIMATELGLPVPPGFTLTTEACRAYLADGWPAGLDEELRVQMARVEEAVGRGFGDPADPLLVSVRSGAPVSMPGMLDTILNLGLNGDTTPGLATAAGDGAFAAACRERLETMYREIVGVEDVPEDLRKELAGMKQEDLVALALKEGKTSPEELDKWGRDLALKSPEQFKLIVLSRPVGSVVPVEKISRGPDDKETVVDDAVLQVAKMMGNTEDDLKKYAQA